MSLRFSPIMWNNSVSTASVVKSGNRHCSNASTQIRCHRSVLSRSARMAPVSTRASAPIPPPQMLTHHPAYALGAPGIAARQDSEAFRRSPPKALLFHVVVIAHAGTLHKPLLGSKVQNGGNRSLTAPSLALQVRFEGCGKTPAVHFRLHALHCSAPGSHVMFDVSRPCHPVDRIESERLAQATIRRQTVNLDAGTVIHRTSSVPFSRPVDATC